MFRTLLSKSLIVSGNIRINMASDHNFIMAFFNCGFISSDIAIEDKTIDWVGIVLVDEHSPSINSPCRDVLLVRNVCGQRE